MKRLLLLFVVLLSVMHIQAGACWQRSVSNFSRQMYNAGGQNWMISEGDCGWMYFANNKGLLEYDGVYWNLYGIGQNVKARAVLAVGHSVYVGGLGEFGMFRHDRCGHLRYYSLSSNIKSRKAINVWHIRHIAILR